MSHSDEPHGGLPPEPAADRIASTSEERSPTTSSEAPVQSEQAIEAGEHPRSPNMLPGRERRRFGLERVMVRIVATCGIVAIGVLLAAILASTDVQGWIIGLVVAGVSVLLSAVLWSSRQL